MKNNFKFLFACLLLGSGVTYAQVGVGTTTPNASSALDVTSTTKGFLMPRMTTTERTAIATPATGLQVYDTDTNSQWYFNGTVWVKDFFASDSKWVDDIDNNVVLNSTVALDSVKYSNSGYKLFDKTNTSYTFWRNSTSQHETFDTKTFNFRNLFQTNASKLVTVNPLFNDFTNNAFYGIVDQTDTHSGKTLLNIKSLQVIDRNNTNNYNTMYNLWSSAEHYGTGILSNLYATWSSSIIGPLATVTNSYGSYGSVTNFSANSSTNSFAGYFYNTQRGTGLNTNVYGVFSSVDAVNSSSNITNVYSGRFDIQFPNSYTGTITNAYGLFINQRFMGTTTNVTNEYGLYINNLTRGSSSRYAIYTNDGLIYFKDKVGMGTTTPTVKLDINDSVNQEALKITTGLDGRILGIRGELLDFKRNGSNYINASNANGNFIFGTGGDATSNIIYQRMFITSTGNVGIATSTPTEKLDVNGAIKIGSTSAATPTAGTIRFNTTTSKFEGYDGTAWVAFH